MLNNIFDENNNEIILNHFDFLFNGILVQFL